MSASNFNLFSFWAKTAHDQQPPRGYHPLLCHMVDVGVVARELWRSVLPRSACHRITRGLGLDDNDAEACVAWLIGLHDIGKASPPFTLRKSATYLHSLYDGSPFGVSPNRVLAAKDAPHGIVTAQALPEILRELNFPVELAKQIATAIGGHHGVIPRSEEINSLKRSPDKIGHVGWQAARRNLAHELARLLMVTTDSFKSLDQPLDNAALMWLAGLTSVADWIGSNQSFFNCRVEDAERLAEVDFTNYVVESEACARKALQQLGWMNWKTPDQARTFQQLFPDKHPPRGVQNAAVDLAIKLHTPGIVVIEAPMGEGKTEAAMYLADCWTITLAARGCYFALPTQATSNQMFGRVRDFLAMRSDKETATLQLLHGHAALSAEFQLLLREGVQLLNAYRVGGIHNDDESANAFRRETPAQASVVAAEWFTYRKRGLLAPFGVGTIDQSLLAVLQTHHVFVRLFALAHKVVIIDEVHAYDAYMSLLLERLIEWLAALGSPVILLSATLPRIKRQALLRAYTRGLADTAPELEPELIAAEDAATYPRLSWATATHADARHIETSAQSTRTLRVEWIYPFDSSDDEASEVSSKQFNLGGRLRDALTDSEGNLRGCVAIICNTVRRAQDVYQALLPYFPDKAFLNDSQDQTQQLDLLHARYLFRDRAVREKRTLSRFGKPGAVVEVVEEDDTPRVVRRPACAVLVSTQIIEQSLDIDFDLMVSELAPADLLLQRAGRIHRHARAGARPANLQQPTLWVVKPTLNDTDTPDFGASKYVYAPHILLRSWLNLRESKTIEIPAEVEELIEAVYDDGRTCPADEPRLIQKLWRETAEDLRRKREMQESKARQCRLPSPNYDTDELLDAFNRKLEEDDPEVHSSLQALTRDDSLPSVSVVCLKPPELSAINLAEKPHIGEVKFLLERSVRITKPGAVQAILMLPIPGGWRESPHLRHHRLIELDAQDCRFIGGYEVKLDSELGVVINKQNEGNS